MKKDSISNHVDVNKDFYEGDYVDEFKSLPLSRLEQVVKLIEFDPSDEVADYACGDAKLLELIHGKVKHYTGIDFSQKFIESSKQRAKAFNISNADFEACEIVEYCARNTNRFDKVFTMDFSEHISDEQFIDIYKSIIKSLKPGGKLYLHTPNAMYFLEIMKKRNIILKQLQGHIAVRSLKEYMILLKEIGFQTIRYRYLPHYQPPMSCFHFLSYIPVLGDFFRQDCLLNARKQEVDFYFIVFKICLDQNTMINRSPETTFFS